MAMGKINICLTGSNGFIGSHLTKILSSNNEIILTPFEGNLLIKEDIESFFDANIKIDQIIHLAGSFIGDFDELLNSNVLTTQNLLDVAEKNKVNKIIYASTGAVYGEPIMQESVEDDPLKPNTLYGLSKMYAEDCIKYYANNFNIEFVILRFPNVYGENNKKGVIYNFLDDIKTKQEITIYGTGTQSRNFLHVIDACQAIEKAIYYDKSDIFNISNSIKTSINDVVSILKCKFQFNVAYRPQNNNLKDLLLCVDKAKKELHFSSFITNLEI